MASVDIDTSELRRFAADLTKAAGRVLGKVDAVMKHGAQNVKEQMRADASASQHFKGMAGSVSYDSVSGLRAIGYEVGPDKDRRGGALGNIAYFGTPRGGGSLDLDAPLRAEEPRILKALGDLGEGLLR